MYKVLIVEDEDMIRNGLHYMMDWTALDCVVAGEASNGEEGLEQIAAIEPDIVLLDINMPIMSGLEMLATYDEEPPFSIIILSGYDDFQYAKRAIEYRVIEYLLKPVDHRELRAAVEHAKERVQQKQKLQLLQTSAKQPDELHVLDMHVWNKQQHPSSHVAQMIAYVQENYDQKISMNDLVEALDRSATYLNNKFKESTTYTFNEFLNRYRVHRAIEMLRQGDCKISMLALDVGFSNYRYFIKVFKRYTNVLPSDFAKYYQHHNEPKEIT